MDKSVEIIQVYFRSSFFFKDSLERKHFYEILSDIKRIDQTKLIYISMLSVETLLKAIIILKLPISITDKKIQKILKSLGHKLYNLYLKTHSNTLNEEQINLLKQRDDYGVDIRYSTDAFFNGLEIKGMQSNKKPREKEEIKRKIQKQFFIYNALYQNLLAVYRESLKNLDIVNGPAVFDNMINEKCSLGVATSHHCFYKENYF